MLINFNQKPRCYYLAAAPLLSLTNSMWPDSMTTGTIVGRGIGLPFVRLRYRLKLKFFNVKLAKQSIRDFTKTYRHTIYACYARDRILGGHSLIEYLRSRSVWALALEMFIEHMDHTLEPDAK